MAALGTALVVGSGFGVYVASRNVPRVQPVETREVVVMARGVDERMVIPREALRLTQAPVELIPDGAVSRPEEAEGKLAAGKLVSGEILMRHRLTAISPDAGLAVHLLPTEVAVTFPATGIASVAGLLPGDRVDILATLRQGSMGSPVPRGAFTTVALQDLRVLSVSKPSTGTRQGGVAGKVGEFLPVPTAAEGTGQVVIAADYQDALFLKSLKDADNVTLDLVLRPVGEPQLAPGEGLTLPEGFQRRKVSVP